MPAGVTALRPSSRRLFRERTPTHDVDTACCHCYTCPVSNVAGSALAPGTTVAGYRIEALIGRGGMGAVYRAEEEGLGRKVALKVIAPELAQDERFRERFLRESQIAASLDHPHVIPIYQAGERGRRSLPRDALRRRLRSREGRRRGRGTRAEARRRPPLADRARRSTPRTRRASSIATSSPRTSSSPQSAGREHCYLGDFGLTKRTGSLSGVSVAGEIVGTLEYVAPGADHGRPDGRACRTSTRSAVSSTSASPGSRPSLARPTSPSCGPTCTRSRRRRARLDPTYPRSSTPCSSRALAKEPGRRYRSAGELLAATRSALRLVDAAPAAPDARAGAIAVVAAVALLAVAALGAFLARRASSERALERRAQLGRRYRPRLEQARRRRACRRRAASDRRRRGRCLGHERRGRDRLPHRPHRHDAHVATITVGRLSERPRGRGRHRLGRSRRARRARQRINPEQNEAASPTPRSATTRPAAHRARASRSARAPSGSSARAARWSDQRRGLGSRASIGEELRRCRRAPCFRSSRTSPSGSARSGS